MSLEEEEDVEVEEGLVGVKAEVREEVVDVDWDWDWEWDWEVEDEEEAGWRLGAIVRMRGEERG